MATLNATARGAVSATARPRAGTITIEVCPGTILTLTPSEALSLAVELNLAAQVIEASAAEAVSIQRAMAQAELPVARA
ncbi:hypothetical protein [Stenotrophomonas maltophilia]|uniref:hypothetical protein n=1 Tax=Stenotrophomonas maltophilia TaxID=40324 RepID=UPI0013DB1530|nr:hypothetical protein [Stenotrophomonas maltophilia]